MTPLHFAAMNGQEVILLELIKHGANLDAQNFVSVHYGSGTVKMIFN